MSNLFSNDIVQSNIKGEITSDPKMLKLKSRSNVFICASPWHDSIDGNPFQKGKNHVGLTLHCIWWLDSLKHTFPRNIQAQYIAEKLKQLCQSNWHVDWCVLDHLCILIMCWFQIDFNILNSRYESISWLSLMLMHILHLNCMISTTSCPPVAMGLLLLL